MLHICCFLDRLTWNITSKADVNTDQGNENVSQLISWSSTIILIIFCTPESIGGKSWTGGNTTQIVVSRVKEDNFETFY